MKTFKLSDALSPFSREVLELYASDLADVRFPDLDLKSLHALAAEVDEAQHSVDDLEAQLREARELVAERNAALRTRAERALSYARVYAEGNEALSARVDQISNPTKTESPKKRGRPAKSSPTQLDVLENAAE